jgi:hypothetical protein
MLLTFDPDLLDFLRITTGEINDNWLTQAEIVDIGRIRLYITQTNSLVYPLKIVEVI